MSWPWPAPLDDGRARHLVRGVEMPDIALPATSGQAVSPARLSGWAVVFCYPWAGRPGVPNPPGWDAIPGAHGSTPEAEGFRDLYHGFAEMPSALFGLSLQPREEQQELVARLKLPYELLSDAAGTFRKATHLPVFETGGKLYLSRLTLVLRDGRIEHVFYPVHPPHSHAREVLALMSAKATYAEEARLRSVLPQAGRR